jgi:hypothetical protein
MKLAFKNKYSFGFTYKEVDITLNLGTLEAVCKSLGIEFYQISETVKKNNFDFTVELLYQGYITACKDKFQKPKYNIVHANIWNEQMSKSAQSEFVEKMTLLFGEITKMTKTSKKKVVQK